MMGLIWVESVCKVYEQMTLVGNELTRAQARGKLGRNSLPNLAHFSLFSTGGEVLMYKLP